LGKLLKKKSCRDDKARVLVEPRVHAKLKEVTGRHGMVMGELATRILDQALDGDVTRFIEHPAA
jgi:hypothetical protein